jgi:hypothetical protein
MSEMGHFAYRSRAYLTEKTINLWFYELLDAIKSKDDLPKKQLKEQFDYYLKKTLSRKERMNIY